jgi:uncharacterized membrane protein
MDDKKILTIISSYYLAIGSIALFISFSCISFIIYYYLPYEPPNSNNISITYAFSFTTYWLTFMIMLIAGILLILSYHGFINHKNYSKSIGIFGCIILTLTFLYYIYYFGTNWSEYLQFASPSYITIKIGHVLLGLASVILLSLTTKFWKKLK